MAQEWWLSGLRPEISQGDIISGVPIGTVLEPVTYLQHAALKGGSNGWVDSLTWKPDPSGSGFFRLRGKVSYGLVVSYDCEIDKPNKGTRITVAPVIPITTLQPDQQQRVMTNPPLRFMPLPQVPGIGDCYSDLRLITYYPGIPTAALPRVASMTDEAVLRLQAQIVGFFTRIDYAKLIGKA